MQRVRFKGTSVEVQMINRENWKLTKKYMAYLSEVRQLDDGTVLNMRSHLRHILEWADETSFSKAADIRPTFPRYVTDRLSAGSAGIVCGTARRFFDWLRLSNKRMSKSITELWCRSLVSKSPGRIKQYDEYTLDDVKCIVALKSESLRVRRDKAACAFLFLSGARIGAFSTLPIKAIDLDNLSVKQWPELGVMTKRKKAATTFLLNLLDLLAIVREWDDLVRSHLPDDALWYAPLDADGKTLLDAKPSEKRGHKLEDRLEALCALAGVNYRSVHNFRHGFAVYGLKNAKDLADMEAVSKNLMHKSLEITLGVYAVLNEGDVKSRIINLGVSV